MTKYNVIVNWFADGEFYNNTIIVNYNKINNNFIVTVKSLNCENLEIINCSGVYETIQEVQAGISNFILYYMTLYTSVSIKSWYSKSYNVRGKYEFFEKLTDEEFSKLRNIKKVTYYHGNSDVISNLRFELF